MGRKKASRDESEAQQQLMKATLDVIKEKGIDGATARAIADVAGLNQSLIFYYFGSVTGLIVESVRDMSATRRILYTDALAKSANLQEAATKVFDIFKQDRKACSFVVLSQFVVSASNNEQIAKSLEEIYDPWLDLIEIELQRLMNNAVLPNDITYKDAAMSLMSLFMGIQFMAGIDTYEKQVEGLISKAPNFANLLALLPMLLGSIPGSAVGNDQNNS